MNLELKIIFVWKDEYTSSMKNGRIIHRVKSMSICHKHMAKTRKNKQRIEIQRLRLGSQEILSLISRPHLIIKFEFCV